MQLAQTHCIIMNVQVRATGAVDPVIMQPIKGRKVGGGIRFGEMERDSLLAHGAAYLLHDRLHSSSDYKPCYLCNACGSLLSPTWVPNVTPKGMEHLAGVGGVLEMCHATRTVRLTPSANRRTLGVQPVPQRQVCGADCHSRGVSVFGGGAGSDEHKVVGVCRRPAYSLILMAIKAAVTLINRKSTFDAGVASLMDIVAAKSAAQAACDRAGYNDAGPLADEQAQDELMSAVARCMTLCKSRYSSPVYWKRALDLVQACSTLFTNRPAHLHTLQTYAHDIRAFLADDPDQPQEASAAQPFLFEGQLSEEPDHVRNGPGALYHLEQQLLQV